MAERIQQRIVRLLQPKCDALEVGDVRIGLGYSCVKLSNGDIGLAWTGKNDSGNCTHMAAAGTIAGRSALNLLEMLLASEQALPRTLGLATANALVAGLPRPESTKEDFLDIVNVNDSDCVVMVGFFGPVIPKLRKRGCKLDILELKNDKPGALPFEEGKQLLAGCSVAIITATSIITNTFDELMAHLGSPRAVILLGPSAIMYPEVFTGTPVTHISGSRVLDGQRVKKVVSEGGGTQLLKQYLSFETICL
ncbi:MAG: DUF364 domain-containing protein [Dehalococcoidales bacterium]|nr:DUF364 domain-containing protein [Dehalococcoidales bacterium]